MKRSVLLRLADKAESLTHISVGQRPTSGIGDAIKAEGLAEGDRGFRPAFMRKAYSLGKFFMPFRRAAGLRPLLR